MYLTDQELVERFHDKRPGLDLIAIENAAVPVTTLNVAVLAQEKKPVSLLDEFLLRSVKGGLRDTSAISLFLGIEPKLLESALVNQLAAQNIRYSPQHFQVDLTKLGERNAQELSVVTPIEIEVPIAFDRTLWRPKAYRVQELIWRKEAERQGMILIPASRSTSIRSSDLSSRDVQRMVRSEEDDDRVQILDVLQVRRNRNAYLPVKMLVFVDRDTAETEFLIVVDGEESLEHQTELAAAGGLPLLNISMATDAEGQIETVEAPSIDSATTDPLKDSEAPPDGSAPLFRQLSVYEHGTELQKALTSSKSRILIISPWVRRAVVGTQFLADLERRLRAGVHVAIGHGYGEDDRGSDEDAIRRLSNLQHRYSSHFLLARLPNTHAKILIHDDTYITTSFNWLSFRGDPKRTYRMEEGTLIESRAYSNEVYGRYLETLTRRA